VSAPVATSAPTLRQQGDRLVAGNGGWDSASGPVSQYVYVFQMDGVTRQGTVPLPFEGYRDGVLVARPPDQLPPGAGINEFLLHADDVGHAPMVFVYGGYRSRYELPDGTVPWDGWEWGRVLSSDGSDAKAPLTDDQGRLQVVNSFTVAPPPPPPPVPVVEPAWMPYVRAGREQLGIAVALMEQAGVPLDGPKSRRRSRAAIASSVLFDSDVQLKRDYNLLAQVHGWPVWA
jgi:hypothetical protein